MRRSAVYGLTYVIGFLAALTFIAASTQADTTVWLPLGLGVLFFTLLGLLPPFKNVVLRLPVAGIITSGSLAAWFLSEPPAASEPNHRITVIAPLLGASGPVLCLIVVLLLWEDRRLVARSVWNWLMLSVALAWLVSYYSASHSANGVLVLPHSSFRYNSDVGQAQSLSHRGVLQVLCFGSATVAAVGLAYASRASRWATMAFGLLIPFALVFFDEGRYRFEFAEQFAKRSLALDTAVVVLAFGASMAAVSIGGRARNSRLLA